MKKVILSIISLVFFTSLWAQEKVSPRYEITIHAGGGISSLQYDPEHAKQSIGFGGKAGLGYTLFFSKHWGIETGVGVDFFTAQSKPGNDSDGSYNAVTNSSSLLPGTDFVFSYNLNDYKEKQQILYLTIPLMFQYQTAGKDKFYVALGGKIGFPMSATYKTDNYTLATSGYFPTYGRTIDDLPEYGLGQYTGLSNDGNLEFDIAYFASGELGMKWVVGKNNALYTGIYCDYGLNNIQKENSQTFVAYNDNGNLPMNSLVQSQINGKAVVGKINPLAVGIKISFALGVAK